VDEDQRVVVRGGLLELPSLLIAMQQALDDPLVGRLELTVYVGNAGETAGDVAGRIPVLSGYRRLRQSTVRRLRDAGFDVVDCEPDGHCQVVFDEVDEVQLETFAQSFDEPEANQGFRGKT
jgi:hypothetical protein